MKRLIPYLRPYLPRMWLGLFIKFTGTIMDLFLPWILSYMIDDVVPRRDAGAIVFWGVVMVVCAIVAVVGNVTANRMASWVAQHTTEAIRRDLFRRIAYLSCRQVDEFTIPSLESRLTTDTYHVHELVGRMQRLGVRAPILLLGGILVTLALDWALALVLIGTLPLLGLLVYFVSRKSVPMYTQLQGQVDAMVRTVRENISGVRVIKALSKEEFERERFSEVNRSVVHWETRAGVVMSLTNPMMNLLLNLGLAVVILVGAYRVQYGLMQTGTILAFLTYFTIILNAMLSITRMFVMYSRGLASARRIAEVLDTPMELEREEIPAPEQTDPPHLAFSHVSFSYRGKGYSVEDLSFSLRRGETLGIIGATGSGKTTVAALLQRFYDPTEGVIQIDGVDVRAIDPDSLHRKFGVTFQNDILFADTIRQNIDFGRGLPEEQIRKAARCAQALEFIEALEDGFDHRLTSRGTNLSGGQKQRLLVARALAGNPEILILDDSSSALDYRTDAMLRRALREEYGGITSILIAQRISSILHADRILVLEEGRAIGYGTHEQLLASCEVYREISESQMGGGEIA